MLKREMVYHQYVTRFFGEETDDFEFRLMKKINEIPYENIISLNYISPNNVSVIYKHESIVSLIAAKSVNNVIGKDGKIPWKSKEDMQLFKEITTGNIVIMGRKTYESMGSKPLPNRINVVLTRQHDFNPNNENVIVKDNLVDTINEMRLRYPGKEVIIIGGESLYKEALEKDLIHRMYLNTIYITIEGGDTFFPEFKNYGGSNDILLYKPTDISYKVYNVKNCYPDEEKIEFSMKYYERQ